jgi:hypothetical protein
MLDTDTKRRIDTAREIHVGKVPHPKSQVEQITIALIYKFIDDMDAESEELGGKRKFFTGDYARYGWAKLMAPSLLTMMCRLRRTQLWAVQAPIQQGVHSPHHGEDDSVHARRCY